MPRGNGKRNWRLSKQQLKLKEYELESESESYSFAYAKKAIKKSEYYIQLATET